MAGVGEVDGPLYQSSKSSRVVYGVTFRGNFAREIHWCAERGCTKHSCFV